MILKKVYAPTVYVDGDTGRIIDREEIKNLSYKSRLEQHEEIKDTTKVIHSVRIIVVSFISSCSLS